MTHHMSAGHVAILPPGSDIFASGAHVLVNPVNCVGTSGAGLAKLFARRFPQYDRDYRAWCRGLRPTPGCLLLTSGAAKQSVIHFATKDHWRNPSRIEWIRDGLGTLLEMVEEDRVRSIATPALGCGRDTGQLDWEEVRPLLVEAGEKMAKGGVRVMIYEPHEQSGRR